MSAHELSVHFAVGATNALARLAVAGSHRTVVRRELFGDDWLYGVDYVGRWRAGHVDPITGLIRAARWRDGGGDLVVPVDPMDIIQQIDVTAVVDTMSSTLDIHPDGRSSILRFASRTRGGSIDQTGVPHTRRATVPPGTSELRLAGVGAGAVTAIRLTSPPVAVGDRRIRMLASPRGLLTFSASAPVIRSGFVDTSVGIDVVSGATGSGQIVATSDDGHRATFFFDVADGRWTEAMLQQRRVAIMTDRDRVSVGETIGLRVERFGYTDRELDVRLEFVPRGSVDGGYIRNVTFAAGQTVRDVTFKAAAAGTANVTATYQDAKPAAVDFAIAPARLSLTADRTHVAYGTRGTLTVGRSGPTDVPLIVRLDVDNPLGAGPIPTDRPTNVVVPARSVTILAGQRTATLHLRSDQRQRSGTSTITAVGPDANYARSDPVVVHSYDPAAALELTTDHAPPFPGIGYLQRFRLWVRQRPTTGPFDVTIDSPAGLVGPRTVRVPDDALYVDFVSAVQREGSDVVRAVYPSADGPVVSTVELSAGRTTMAVGDVPASVQIGQSFDVVVDRERIGVDQGTRYESTPAGRLELTSAGVPRTGRTVYRFIGRTAGTASVRFSVPGRPDLSTARDVLVYDGDVRPSASLSVASVRSGDGTTLTIGVAGGRPGEDQVVDLAYGTNDADRTRLGNPPRTATVPAGGTTEVTLITAAGIGTTATAIQIRARGKRFDHAAGRTTSVVLRTFPPLVPIVIPAPPTRLAGYTGEVIVRYTGGDPSIDPVTLSVDSSDPSIVGVEPGFVTIARSDQISGATVGYSAIAAGVASITVGGQGESSSRSMTVSADEPDTEIGRSTSRASDIPASIESTRSPSRVAGVPPPATSVSRSTSRTADAPPPEPEPFRSRGRIADAPPTSEGVRSPGRVADVPPPFGSARSTSRTSSAAPPPPAAARSQSHVASLFPDIAIVRSGGRVAEVPPATESVRSPGRVASHRTALGAVYSGSRVRSVFPKQSEYVAPYHGHGQSRSVVAGGVGASGEVGEPGLSTVRSASRVAIMPVPPASAVRSTSRIVIIRDGDTGGGTITVEIARSRSRVRAVIDVRDPVVVHLDTRFFPAEIFGD